MINKIISVVIIFTVVMFLFSARCVNTSPREYVEIIDDIALKISKTQITDDENLIGEREYYFDDCYTGEYYAQCDNVTGRDVVFGGASVKERRLKLKVDSTSNSGNFKIRIRLGYEAIEYNTYEDGSFEKELEFNGGGNYIMIDYDNFSGNIKMTCEYI